MKPHSTISMRPALACLLAWIVAMGEGWGQSESELQQGFMDGQAVLAFQPDLPREDALGFLRQHRLAVQHHYPRIDAYWVRFDAERDVRSLITTLTACEKIAWAHPNQLGFREITPNDAALANSWALHNVGQTVQGVSGLPDADIDAPEGWNLRHDASAIRIAIVDSGCNLGHQDLAANIWTNPGEIPNNGVDDDANGQIDDIHGWDFVGNDAMMTDLTGHGTQVTGVICMRGNNTIGSAGVCWEAQAMIIKDGNSVPQLAAAAAGIEYATMNGAAVCNLSASFGAGVFPLLQSAIGVAQASGMIVCVAAGNAGNNLDLVGNVPATYTNDNIVVVAASTSQDQHASFSNFGASTVDVHAPGVSIYTTDFNTQTSFSYVGGTSFSAPIVTGCLALMRAHNPGADHGTVIAALLGSVDSIPALAGSTVSSGRVNLHQALVAIGVSVGAPTPDPMSFVMPPILLTESVVRMVASPALPGPVEYRFDLVAGSGSGGNSSSWQSTSTHLDTGLLANTQFSYQVRARNATTLAETAPSTPSSIWTPARAPSSVTIASLSNTSVTVGTIAAASNPPTTEYALEFDGLFPDLQGQLNPTRTWAVATVWDGVVISGLSAGSTHTLRARARNGAGIATADSSLQTLTTSWLSACAAGAVGTAVGGPFDVFSIDGSSGGPTRSLTLTVGSPIPTLIATPPTSSVPVNHALFGWIGIPGSGHEFPISPSVGTLCFLPCGPASFVVWTTFGPSPCGSMIPATPTPFSVVNPGYPFSLPPITFQALVEESPGIVRIANALVLRYQ